MSKMVVLNKGIKVADLKLHYIENIIRQAEKCKNILRIILFGSSIEERCTDRSDIDIAVFGKMKKTKYLDSKEFKSFQDGVFMYDFDQDYDILYFQEDRKNHDLILDDINKGIEIYRSVLE